MSELEGERVIEKFDLFVSARLRRGFGSYYAYTGLQPQSIQIARLFPGKPTDELNISLHNVELLRAPDYEALSYEWGTRKGEEFVCCEGGNVPITANLLAALKKLRLRSESRYLWMDAICIDQKNLKERSEQAQLIKEIYSRATRVVIWIGGEGPSPSQAFDLLGDLAKAWCSYKILRQPRYIPSPSSLPFDESLLCLDIAAYGKKSGT